MPSACQLTSLPFLDIEPKCFISWLFQFFHMRVLLSLQPPILLEQPNLPPFSSSFFWQLLFRALGFLASGLPGFLADFWLLTGLSPPLPPHPLLSLSFSPCHHLFSITLLSGWLMLETFQEFLIENTMRTVITSVSPGREAALGDDDGCLLGRVEFNISPRLTGAAGLC